MAGPDDKRLATKTHLGDESEDMNITNLANAMSPAIPIRVSMTALNEVAFNYARISPILALLVHLWIKIAVVKDDGICPCQTVSGGKRNSWH